MTRQLIIDGSVPLAHLGLIRARGADAVAFLQGQLTNDVSSMSLSQVRLAGFCSAKGRLQASFMVWKVAPDDVLLVCAASVLPATLKRMTMFVLRSQCKLSDASAELTLTGVVGSTALALAGETAAWSKCEIDAGTLLRLPDVHGVPRCMLAAPPARDASAGSAVSLDAWRLLEVQSGVPIIEAATVDHFVPQMVNYEVVGGVDFKKGCYPGQEVVARSHYRGTVKRRMFLFECAAVANAGDEVFHDGDASQPAGMVVNAAPLLTGGSGCAALVEVKLAAVGAGSLRLGSDAGPSLLLRALPYEVPTEATLPA